MGLDRHLPAKAGQVKVVILRQTVMADRIWWWWLLQWEG